MRVLFCFGLNEDGQCCAEDDSNIWYPAPVVFPTCTTLIVQVSAGSRHTLALSQTGHVFSWGWGRNGQLGLGMGIYSSNPRQIPSLKNVTTISAGGMHSGCIDCQNSCYTWGSSTCGQLGRDIHLSEGNNSGGFVPGLVIFSETKEQPILIKISCGGMHTAVLDAAGAVYCWGKSDSGQTGYQLWYKEHSTGVEMPHKVLGAGKAVDVSCGGFHTLILRETGTVCGMGKEDYGCLGLGRDQDRLSVGAEVPTLISTLKTHWISLVATGGWHSVFLTSSGAVHTCGKGEYGRLGLGEETSHTEPTLVADTISSSFGNTAAVNSSSTNNSSTLQPTVTVPTSPITMISAGGSHTVWANRTQVFTVGRVHGGRLGVGCTKKAVDRFSRAKEISRNIYSTPLCTVVAVSAGGAHTAVLMDYPEVPEGSEEQVVASFLEQVVTFQRKLTRRTLSFDQLNI